MAEDERSVNEPESRDAQTVYVGLDGTGIPVRKSMVDGYNEKKPDGSAKIREIKPATVWSAKMRDPKQGLAVRDLGSPSRNTVIKSVASRDTNLEASPSAKPILRELEHRRFHEVERQVIIGDGAARISNPASGHLPETIQIVDTFRAPEHHSDIAKATYGPGTETTTAWGEWRCDGLDWPGGIGIVVAGIEHDSACRNDAAHFSNNRGRMPYPEFRKEGLGVSSGSRRGHLQARHRKALKQDGTHWTVDVANAILALRRVFASDHFDGFWERRAGGSRQNRGCETSIFVSVENFQKKYDCVVDFSEHVVQN